MKVICQCGEEMKRTGGVFGEIITDTLVCFGCGKAVNVITLPKKEREELWNRLKEQGGLT